MTDKAKENDKDENSSDDDEAFKIYTTKKIIQVHDIYLTTSFEAPENYTKLYHALDKASKHETFKFYLNNYGGRVDSLLQFASKLSKTKAKTIAIIESPVYSCAAIFPLLCNKFEIAPNTYMFFHNFSTGYWRQKGNEIKMSIDNSVDHFKRLLSDKCTPFLTEQEIEDLTRGIDLYVTADDANNRIKQIKVRNKK